MHMMRGLAKKTTFDIELNTQIINFQQRIFFFNLGGLQRRFAHTITQSRNRRRSGSSLRNRGIDQ